MPSVFSADQTALQSTIQSCLLHQHTLRCGAIVEPFIHIPYCTALLRFIALNHSVDKSVSRTGRYLYLTAALLCSILCLRYSFPHGLVSRAVRDTSRTLCLTHSCCCSSDRSNSAGVLKRSRLTPVDTKCSSLRVSNLLLLNALCCTACTSMLSTRTPLGVGMRSTTSDSNTADKGALNNTSVHTAYTAVSIAFSALLSPDDLESLLLLSDSVFAT